MEKGQSGGKEGSTDKGTRNGDKRVDGGFGWRITPFWKGLLICKQVDLSVCLVGIMALGTQELNESH